MSVSVEVGASVDEAAAMAALARAPKAQSEDSASAFIGFTHFEAALGGGDGSTREGMVCFSLSQSRYFCGSKLAGVRKTEGVLPVGGIKDDPSVDQAAVNKNVRTI